MYRRDLAILLTLIFPLLIFTNCSKTSTSPTNDNDSGTEDPGPSGSETTTGTAEITVATTGADVDSDGYVLLINGSEVDTLSQDESTSVDELEEGDHEAELSSIAENCSVDGNNPTSFTIEAEKTTTVAFNISCEAKGVAPLVNKIAYGSTGEGGGYTKLYIMDTDGGNPTMLHAVDDTNVLHPDISPDGRKIVFSSGSFDNYIYTINSDGSGLTQLTTEDDYYANDYGPAWSPDGTQIAFERRDDIYVMNADGSNQVNVTNSPDSFERDASWSPDGKKLIYQQGVIEGWEELGGNLLILDVETSATDTLTKNTELVDRSPSWSPNGDKIVFTRGEEYGSGEVFTINVDGTDLQQLTDMPAGTWGGDYANSDPDWSSDASKIIFAGMRDNPDLSTSSKLIYIMNADGTDAQALDNGTINHGESDWSPVQE